MKHLRLALLTAATLATARTYAQDAAPTTPPAVAAPVAPAFPPYSGPLSANARPFGFDTPLAHVVVSGAATGVGVFTSYPGAFGSSEPSSRADIANGQVFVQTTTGIVQFAVQAGIYSLPALGAPYLKATRATDLIFGPVPQAFIRIVPNGEWTITGGLIPTLYGSEYTFTFQNQNIERGLLWAQEPAISRGVQAGYAKGKIAINVSLNDGFYSDKLNWLVGSFAYTIDPKNSFSVVAGGNIDRTGSFRSQAPPANNNGELYNFIYTYKTGPWTVNPYFQYARTHVIPAIGLTARAESIGGALLVNRTFKRGFSIAARGEFEKSYVHGAAGAPNLFGYGTRADAFSLTLTPAVQMGPLFLRADVSYTGIGNVDPGLGFGSNFDHKQQYRSVIEAGVLF